MSDSEDNVPLAQKFHNDSNSSVRSTSAVDSDEDMPLAAKLSAINNGNAAPQDIAYIKQEPADSSDDELPLAVKLKAGGINRANDASMPLKQEPLDGNDSDSDVPLSTPSSSVESTSKKRKLPKADRQADKLKKRAVKTEKKAVKKENGASSRRGGGRSKADKMDVDVKEEEVKVKVKKQEEEADGDAEDNEHRWWLNQDRDASVKWTTLRHNGVLFPPEYKPHGVPLIYDGKEVVLEPAAEEVATFFAQVLHMDHATNPVFQKNFFSDFLKILGTCKKPTPIKRFDKCDFSRIAEYFEQEKERRKQMSKEELKAIKEEKLAIEEKYAYCMLDGRKEKIGNFRIEPPSLLRGRGAHPKTGCLKSRIMPEQVILNLDADAPVPPPPPGHQWGGIIHDPTVTWLATWKENVNNSTKYVFLAANSSIKGQSDMNKFEKARELKTCIDKIRREYTRDLKSRTLQICQRATAMYLIDRFALRAGNEKGEDEADTVGCCTLRYEHVNLVPPNRVCFDFLGKDSIRYYREVEVDTQVWKNLKSFKASPKKSGDPLFDQLTTATLNRHLSSLMPGLTAKVFRTYNASHTFEKELEKTPRNTSVAEKVLAYNRANREVAVLCNHQRAVPKRHDDQMLRVSNKIKAIKYLRWRAKRELLQLNPKVKKSNPKLVAPESDLEEEWCIEYEDSLIKKEYEKANLKVEKLKEKVKSEGGPAPTDGAVQAILDKAKEYEERVLSERKSGQLEVKRAVTEEKLKEAIAKLSERIVAAKSEMIDKDENKATALSTSKINYIDPRITAAWCRAHDVPLTKMFNATLRDKFRWAMDVDATWKF
ncbi:DNA topoisomerase I [Syncephalis pseudoplumigaleata]|uniref:DNA topoisomerase I n=1 Tax=Syncephalis pseudoplumigaleata TaxID=1712513 RepID=A0A4P9Z0H3_9FUNG|nr:DNA topoisomerase I [Syncephalis pseudoplumigaleata]|eukprot:RKP25788.1 DNA topoisomerase I [Syncephalis pseudoplumigaleata]